MRRRLPLVLLVPVIGIALFVGSRDSGGPPTAARRTAQLAAEVRCPTCEGLSAAESDAPASQAIREEIRRRVEAGDTDGEVLGFLVGRYGRDILLEPEATGVAGLVWALPVAALICALAGLSLAFHRWHERARLAGDVAPEDRLLVEQALKR